MNILSGKKAVFNKLRNIGPDNQTQVVSIARALNYARVTLCLKIIPHFRNCIFTGNKPLGIHNGIDGLIKGEIKPIGWSDVTGWIAEVSFFIDLYIYISFLFIFSPKTDAL